MKIFKRILIGLFSLILVIVLAAAGFVYWVVKNPEQAWDQVEKRFFPEDLKITWQDIGFSAHHISGLNFEFDWTIEKLKIVKGTPLLQVPVDHVHLKASLFPKAAGKKMIVHDLQVKAPDKIEVHLEKPEQKEPDKNPFQQAQAIFAKIEKLTAHFTVENAALEIAEFKFSSGDSKPIKLALQAHQDAKSQHPQVLSLTSNIDLPGEKTTVLKVSSDLEITAMGTGKPFLKGTLDVGGAGLTTEQKFSLITQEKVTSIVSEGVIHQRSGKAQIILNPKLRVSLKPDVAVTEIDANFSGLPGPLVKVDHFKFSMKTPLDEDVMWSEKPSQFVATAPIALFFIDPDMRKPLEKSCECKIPEVLKFELKGKTWLANVFSQPSEEKPLVDSQLDIESVHNELLSVDAAAKIKVDKKADSYILTPALDFEGAINNFQGFRRFLDAKNVLIPAPLNLLDGTVKISSHDLVKTSDKGYQLPVTVVTNLISPRQAVRVNTDTVMKLTPDFKELYVDVVAKIDDVQLELPPLDPLKGKPRVALDRRILKEPPKPKPKPSKFKVYLSLSVETTKPAAIRFLSGYFKPLLPITMSLHRSKDKDNTGFIKTEPFQIEYLRRKVQVEKMRIDLPESETKPIPVDARFKIKQTQYTVFIDLTGPINKPNIILSSEPYLPENEIISVLLYDRLSNQLVGSDAETSGNVQAAMADKAIGLFGLWAFAATPIKSFSYNPVTKVYSASVALSDDVTAGIGTNWEEATRVELRKRVSKSWMLTASWVPATVTDAASTDLVLQWEKRF